LNFFVGGTIAWNTHQTPSISMNPISSANLPSGREPTEIQPLLPPSLLGLFLFYLRL
jgi:hypothetical protein